RVGPPRDLREVGGGLLQQVGNDSFTQGLLVQRSGRCKVRVAHVGGRVAQHGERVVAELEVDLLRRDLEREGVGCLEAAVVHGKVDERALLLVLGGGRSEERRGGIERRGGWGAKQRER